MNRILQLCAIFALLALAWTTSQAAAPKRLAICRVPVISADGLRPTSSKAALKTNKFWPNGSTLKIWFKDGNPQIQQQVAEAAGEWARYANLRFEFSNSAPVKESEAHIRITFEAPEGFWSAIGTGSANRSFVPTHSMSLYHMWTEPPDEVRKHVLHEFGHALGLLHEHQSPAVKIKWNKDFVYQYLGKAPNFLTPREVDRNVFATMEDVSTNYSEFDPDSIMLYYFPKEFTIDGTGTKNNKDLSETDKVWIGKAYPALSAVPAPRSRPTPFTRPPLRKPAAR